jgi:hypothetical protein
MSGSSCFHDPPQALYICCTVFSCLVSVAMYILVFKRTWKMDKTQVRLLFSDYERHAIFMNYVVIEPCFQGFVIWGPFIGANIDFNSASTVTASVVMNSVSLFLLVLAFIFVEKYRILVHKVQCMRFMMAVVFLCDRDINFSLGFESLFICAIFAVSAFESINVQELISKKVEKRRKLRRARSQPNSASQSDEEMSLANGTEHIITRAALPPPIACDLTYDNDTPKAVRQHYASRERQKLVANSLSQMAETNDRMVVEGMALNIREMVSSQYGPPSASTSVSASEKHADESDSGF